MNLPGASLVQAEGTANGAVPGDKGKIQKDLEASADTYAKSKQDESKAKAKVGFSNPNPKHSLVASPSFPASSWSNYDFLTLNVTLTPMEGWGRFQIPG